MTRTREDRTIRGMVRGLEVVFTRELRTILRTPAYLVLVVGMAAGTVAVASLGGGVATGYLPTVVDVMIWTEVAVPIVAIALGYRAFLTDRQSGEFAILRTYPLGIASYVTGILLARAVAMVAIVVVAFGILGTVVWFSASPDTGIFATHRGIDSPIFYGRYVALTAWLAVVYLWLAIAVGAFATSRRGAIAISTAIVATAIVAGDLLLVRGLAAGGLAATDIPASLVVAPGTTFRGLVFEFVIGIAIDPTGTFIDGTRARFAIIGWPIVGGLGAGLVVWGRRHVREQLHRLPVGRS